MQQTREPCSAEDVSESHLSTALHQVGCPSARGRGVAGSDLGIPPSSKLEQATAPGSHVGTFADCVEGLKPTPSVRSHKDQDLKQMYVVEGRAVIAWGGGIDWGGQGAPSGCWDAQSPDVRADVNIHRAVRVSRLYALPGRLGNRQEMVWTRQHFTIF